MPTEIEANDDSPLLIRLAVESTAAVVSAFSVAPIISIVDKAITSNASGLEPLVPCALNGFKTLFTNPVYFFRQPSFLLIWGVFSGTYTVANIIDAVCERSNRSSFYPVLLGSSVVNVTLSVLKDREFARMFGKGDPKPLPLISYTLFGIRDSMTIFSSFILPRLISSELQKKHGWKSSTADSTAQLMTPVGVQIISSPLHLYGLDLYNRPVLTPSCTSRMSFIQSEYVKTVLARMTRIFPAFGVGGVVNKHLRSTGMEYLKANSGYSPSASLSRSYTQK
jgi:hypothetical protein